MGASRMTDAERDQIDADAEIFIKTCSDAIKSFKDQGKCKNDWNVGQSMRANLISFSTI